MLLGMMVLVEKKASLKVYWGSKITPDWSDCEEAHTRHNFVEEKSVTGNNVSSNRLPLP